MAGNQAPDRVVSYNGVNPAKPLSHQPKHHVYAAPMHLLASTSAHQIKATFTSVPLHRPCLVSAVDDSRTTFSSSPRPSFSSANSTTTSWDHKCPSATTSLPVLSMNSEIDVIPCSFHSFAEREARAIQIHDGIYGRPESRNQLLCTE
ncbi:hypothetical protein ACFE04_008278 [Oxalis oulophora]